MGPKDIVRTALEQNVDIIAVTDHNSAQNVQAVLDAAKGTSLLVIPGMEVYIREDAHIICLFETVEHALQFQEIIYDHLPDGENDPDWYGPQLVVDGHENIIEECSKLLGMPTSLRLGAIANFVIDLDGILYPAHIDRKANSLLHVLGFIPNDLPFPALEIAKTFEEASAQHGFLKRTQMSIIRSSDAHMIDQVGTKFTWYKLEEPTFAELKKAIAQQDGRLTALAKEEE
jgi:PHP family Zn ribbon phosphoesterase